MAHNGTNLHIIPFILNAISTARLCPHWLVLTAVSQSVAHLDYFLGHAGNSPLVSEVAIIS